MLSVWLGACAPAAAPPALPAAPLEDLQAAAQAARGLAFSAPVDARFLPPEDLARALRRELDLALPPDLARGDVALKEAVGLLPPGVDLRAAVLGFQERAVVGYYTPLERRLYVVERPRASLPHETALVAVHELVHALQDDNTPLLGVLMGLTEHDDLAFALGALVEGDATWASFRWEEATQGLPPLPAEQLAEDFGVEWAEAAHGATPRWLREVFLLQYPLGYELVTRLVEAGGVAALDAALADPPLTSEELLHPERYLEPRRRRPRLELALESRPPPGAGCRRLAANGFGEIGLAIWARERGLDAATSRRLAEGWAADRAVAWRCPEGRRFAWLLEFDDADAAERFARAAQPLLADLAAGSVRSAPARLDAAGRRVLLSAGLPDADRTERLAVATRAFASLEEFLAAHPEVLERSRALREQARRAP